MNEERKLVFWMAVFLITFFSVMTSCLNRETEEREKLKREDPLMHHKKHECYSKISGSTPACWSETDWQAFCQRVRCMK